MRYCRIESACVEDEVCAGDGAYGLIGVEGTPNEVAMAIANELEIGDMLRGSDWAFIEDGDQELYLSIRIRFARHPLASQEETLD